MALLSSSGHPNQLVRRFRDVPCWLATCVLLVVAVAVATFTLADISTEKEVASSAAIIEQNALAKDVVVSY